MIITLSGAVPIGKQGIIALLQRALDVRPLCVFTTNPHPDCRNQDGYSVLSAKAFANLKQHRYTWIGDHDLHRYGIPRSQLEIADQSPHMYWIALLPPEGALYIQALYRKREKPMKGETPMKKCTVCSILFGTPDECPPLPEDAEMHFVQAENLSDQAGTVAGIIRKHLTR